MDGNKVSFDQFPQCCTSIDGDNRFVSYINEYGRLTEYCGAIAPCVGEPAEVLKNGIIVFNMTNNTIPDNIYQLWDGSCVQVIRPRDDEEVYFESRTLIVTGKL